MSLSTTAAVGCSWRAAHWPLLRRCRGAPSRRRPAAAKLRIGIIGSGHIGGTIGGLWVKAGHPVLFSSRHPDELKDLVAGLGPLAQRRHGRAGDRVRRRRSSSPCPTARCRRSARIYGAALKGKIVLDACNAVTARDGAIAEEVERNGIGVTSQKYLAGTRLVRAFNTLTYMIFAARRTAPIRSWRSRSPATIPRRCRSPPALVRDAGFDPVVVGKLADATPVPARRPATARR